jgi:hypothetical protein
MTDLEPNTRTDRRGEILQLFDFVSFVVVPKEPHPIALTANPVFDSQTFRAIAVFPIVGDQTGALGKGNLSDHEARIGEDIACALRCRLDAAKHLRSGVIQPDHPQGRKELRYQGLASRGRVGLGSPVGELAGGDPGRYHLVQCPSPAFDDLFVTPEQLDTDIYIQQLYKSTRRPSVRAV